jgi:CubicO group peptidase (beta-lactamase class C family)
MKRIRIFATTLLAAAVVTSASGPVASGRQVGDDPSAIIDPIAARAIRDLRLPSLSIAVARSGRMVFAKAYGLADVEHGVHATEKTIYRVGSITKQFTAAAILRLSEQRTLSLDDRVGIYVPALQDHKNITIRHLMNHTSGIRSFTSIPAFAAKERLDLTDDELVAVFRREPADFEAGANFNYNNSGYYLLAMVIERVTGRSYADHMHDELFAPLRLRDTSACDDGRILPHRARGYTLENDTLRNAPFISLVPPRGGGNLCSTAADLATWALALDGRGVSRAAYRLITEPGTLADGRRFSYGLGLFLWNLDGRPEVSHGGGIVGFTGFLGAYPDDGLVIAALTNTDAAHLYDGLLAHTIVRALAGRDSRPSVATSIDVSSLDKLAGTYRIGSATILVRRDGQQLTVSTRGTVEHLWERTFEPRADGTFAAVNNPEIQLVFTPINDGRMRLSILFSGRSAGDAIRPAP